MKIEYRMNINFNRGDLVSFGELLLSESRRERFANSETEASLPLEERLSMVHHADVENWLEERGKVNYLLTHQGTVTYKWQPLTIDDEQGNSYNVLEIIKQLHRKGLID